MRSSDRTVIINWAAAVIGGVAQYKIARIVGVYGPDDALVSLTSTLWAGAGTAVSAQRVSTAQASASTDPLPAEPTVEYQPGGGGGAGGGGTSGGLTNSELRATPVPVATGGLTDAQLRATAVPVSTGGLTDTQLRAAAVPTRESGGQAATSASGLTPSAAGQITASGQSLSFAVPAGARQVSFFWRAPAAGTFSGLSITYEMSYDGGTNWLGLAVAASTGASYTNGSIGAFSSTGTTGPVHQGVIPPGVTDVRARATALTAGPADLIVGFGGQPAGTQVAVTNLASPASLADGASNPNTATVGADTALWNATGWDRARANLPGSTLDSASARTASGNGSTYTNYNGRFVSFFINVTAVTGTTPSMTVRVQEQYDGTNWRDVDITNLQTAAITASGLYVLRLGAGLPVTAASTANVPASRSLRLAWSITGTSPNFTFQTFAMATL